MKVLFYFNLLLIFLLFGCEREDTFNASRMELCVDAGKIVYQVSNQTGRVKYHEDSGTYYLSYHVPNSYDLVLTGIVCNMVEDIPRRDDYIEVHFSGSYKEIKSDPGKGLLGYDIYYLELTELRIEHKTNGL